MIHCNFYDDDFITLTSLLLRTHVQYFAMQQFSFAPRKCWTAWVKRDKWTSPTSKRI